MKRILTAGILILMGNLAQAGFWVEPVVGYNSNTYNMANTSNVDMSGAGAGLHLGVRTGYLAGDWAFGIGYDSDSHKFKPNAGGAEDDVTKTSLNVVLGFVRPMGFRFFLDYGFQPKLSVNDGTSVTNFVTGTAYTLSFGYQFHNNVAVSLDYGTFTPAKWNVDGGTEFDVSAFFSKMNSSTVGLSVSFPFGSGK